ncbi:MAG: Na+/H+ antiporter NhaA [Acidimicrobiia bacterium]|nr:Na+/H+ antiporter NhaA [Acidimicrobiia bacterium]
MTDDAPTHVTWLHSDRRLPSRFVRPLLRFTRVESASGVVLLAAAAAALLWANAPFGDTYERFWSTPVTMSVGAFHLDETLRLVVNDGLMALFFFVVGLEIKREVATGDLRNPRVAALPAVAAIGGMIVPALIYVAFTTGSPAVDGWGIPMATDIAFALGVVALLGSRVPVGGRLFLLALAIADDIGAIVVIAVFYTENIAGWYLASALLTFGLIWIASRTGIRSLIFYVPAALAMWFLLLESGVHATLAGVAVGLLTPARAMYSDRDFRDRSRRILEAMEADMTVSHDHERIDHESLSLSAIARESVPPLHRVENALHPWSSFVVVPLFALANAGVRFDGIALGSALTSDVALGVSVGLLAGKTVGIGLFSWLAVRLRVGSLPAGITWRQITGLAMVAGIGFTVSLFVAGLSFADAATADLAKTGIFAGSLVAGVVGYLVLRGGSPATERQDE